MIKFCIRAAVAPVDGRYRSRAKSHIWAISLDFAFSNFRRMHKTPKVTLAMAAGITDKLMSFEDIIARSDAAAPKPGRPKMYKKSTSKVAKLWELTAS